MVVEGMMKLTKSERMELQRKRARETPSRFGAMERDYQDQIRCLLRLIHAYSSTVFGP